MAKLVENVYGDALFELSLKENKVDETYEEVQVLLTVLKENEDLTRMMTHPHINKEEKLQVVETVFKGKISDEMIGLMRMVIEKDHFGQMEGIFNFFTAKVKEYKNIGVAYVTTPLELSDAKKKQVEFSKMELNVLKFLEQGKTKEEIADYFFVSVNTVKFHMKNIYKKLEADSVHQAIWEARLMGII